MNDAEIRLQCVSTAPFFWRTVSKTAKYWMSAVFVGFLIDCLLGDPARLPHPIVLIGKAIAALEKRLRKAFPATPEFIQLYHEHEKQEREWKREKKKREEEKNNPARNK